MVTWQSGGDLSLAGSRFEVDGRHADLLLRTLPPIIHLQASGDQAALRWSIERMIQELRDHRPEAALHADPAHRWTL